MESKFTKTSEVQNFVFFDLGLDAEMAAGPAAFMRKAITTADAAPPNRIVIERIGHAKHWRA
jgi:hypothetical protein